MLHRALGLAQGEAHEVLVAREETGLTHAAKYAHPAIPPGREPRSSRYVVRTM
jgi:hypothetical protein